MLIDAHCHVDDQQKLPRIQKEHGIGALINCESPAEWQKNNLLIGQQQYLSFGIHPWKADQFQFAELTEYFTQAAVIGEIGLDRVWTEVPLALQLPLFEAQLAYAAKYHKPVVLHTKGCEEEVYQLICRYPNRYLVHWYSAADYQTEYIELGCYFTIGVDLEQNPAVRQLACSAPLDRLLLETDGLAAIAWSLERPVSPLEYPSVLRHSLQLIAAWRKLSPEVLERQLQQNFSRFLFG